MGLFLSVILGAPPNSAVAAEPEPATSVGGSVQQSSVVAIQCAHFLPVHWPDSHIARRQQLVVMGVAVAQCIRHPEFLAAYGALWLDDGEPDQALIWLERALLLNPGQLGAQFDHALALAALGQSEALTELLGAWRGRTDIPVALRRKIAAMAAPAGTYAFQSVRLGGAPTGFWRSRGTLASLLGYESNLDRSPRLSELTLTVPEGPVTLPVTSTPRKGPAVLSSLSWQVAGKTAAGQFWRTGVDLQARAAMHESPTNWQQRQWSFGGSQPWGAAFAQAGMDAIWVGGALGEPYRLIRYRIALERSLVGCVWQGGLEHEQRRQRTTSTANSDTSAAVVAFTCPSATPMGWAFGGALRRAVDDPLEAGRPGGRQQQWTAGLNAQGLLANGARMELSLRRQLAKDQEGYSAQLDYGARRNLAQTQWSAEFARPLQSVPGSEWVLQASGTLQKSNLPLFNSNAAAAYTGLRWAW